MPPNFDSCRSLVDNFNNKYNLKFSYEEFDAEVRRYQSISEDFSFGNNIPGQRYTKAFSDLYPQALTNYADRKIDSFNSADFIRDFTNMMNGYKAVANQNGANIKGWPKPKTLVEKVQRDLNDPKKGIPDTKEEYIIKRYQSRQLPIRKMREHAQALLNSGTNDPAKLSTILAYANALQTINSQRPGWWRFLNYFRNKAEQREAVNFKKIVRSKLGLFKVEAVDPKNKDNIKYSNKLTDEYSAARDISRDNSLLDAKNEIKELSEKLKLDGNALNLEENKAETKKESFIVNELSETVNKENLVPAVSTSASTELNKSDEQLKQEEIKQNSL